ncbi:MAG: hypothetical protein JRI54_03415 [Deltaproteobacteria bacterium]|nr:hypothetical protein [Deltaproteobacteria bacterium]
MSRYPATVSPHVLGADGAQRFYQLFCLIKRGQAVTGGCMWPRPSRYAATTRRCLAMADGWLSSDSEGFDGLLYSEMGKIFDFG